jgi:hypothetical protein
MAANKQIMAALIAKLGVTRRRIGQLAQQRRAELPMSFEHAVYTIAFQNGIDVARYLSDSETADVRALVTSLRGVAAPVTAGPNGGRRSARTPAQPRPVVVTIAGINVEKVPGLSAAHAKEAKLMAERAYPMLYVFENSVRDLIERVLSAKHGADWWDKAIPKKVLDKVEEHKTAEDKDAWHGKRGARGLDYTLLPQLWGIINHNWSAFTSLFPNKPWIEDLITNQMNVSRRVIAHMNALENDDVKNMEAGFRRWVKQLNAVEDVLP